MIPIIINGNKILCPGCYEELTTGTFQRIVKEWDAEEKNIAKLDYFKLFSILTNTNYKSIDQTPENDQTIWNAIGWYVMQPFKFSTELPKILQIGERMISVPRRVGALGTGQNILLRQIIDNSKYMEENISMAVAICLQPLYDNSKFDYDRAVELEKIILEMPIYLTHPVGFFLLQTVRMDGWKHIRDFHQTQSSLKQTLKRMWPQWLRSGSSESLTTYH